MDPKLKEDIIIAGPKAQYDEHAKQLLAHKEVLAQILSNVTTEFKGMEPCEVIPYIEGEVEISKVSILPGKTNMPKIKGTNLESKISGEGSSTYDVRFYATIPNQNSCMEIIVDVEAQKDNPSYDLVARGIFYNARQISSQLDRDFIIPNYKDIKKVYSIWISMNSPKKLENSIVQYTIEPKAVVGNVTEFGKYDLQTVVLVNLSKQVAEQTEKLSLHRYLGTLFSTEMKPEEKFSLLEKEYGPVDENMDKEVREMCNLSDMLVEEERIKLAKEMLADGKPDEEILKYSKVSKEMLADLKKELFQKA